MKVRNIKVVSCEDVNIDDCVIDDLYENWCGASVYGRFVSVEDLKFQIKDYVDELDKFNHVHYVENGFDIKVRGVLKEVNKLDDELYIEFYGP